MTNKVKKLKTRKFPRKNVSIYQHSKNPPNIRLGLCCINNSLREKNIFCSRGMIRRTYTVDRAISLAFQNLNDLQTLLEWNNKKGIHHYRMSSDMFPHIHDPELSDKYTLKPFKEILKSIGEYAKKSNQRITMHPSQFNQIGAISEKVLESTIIDLQHHCDILDYMNLDNNSIICIHGGGTYGNKENTIRRWIEQFDDLPKSIKKRIALENCELQYNIEDCIYIANECKIPIIFDIHHFNCYNQKYDLEWDPNDYIPYVIDSWKERRMVAHISDQKEDARLGAHHDYVESIPDCFLDIPDIYGVGVDIEIEAKAKEKAIFKLYNKYSDLLGNKFDYRI